MGLGEYQGPTRIRYREVTKSGWYLHSDDDVEFQLYQYDDSYQDLLRWRTETGHACVAEQPNFFDDTDTFIGPIEIDCVACSNWDGE